MFPAQSGTQQARPPSPLSWQLPSAQLVHLFPQPSSWPQEPAGQLGTQMHC